ncbi:MAG: hypothetical protein V4729_12850 [Pseudomonadota bacterium]
MRKALQWGLACLAAWGAGAIAAPAVEVPVIEHAGYTFCANEANDAMSLGRMVMVFNRSREQVNADPSLPPYVRGMAADLFRGMDAGEFPTYAHFASRRFMACLETQKVPLEATENRAFACVTRVDIPYFFSVLKRAGESREAAIPKLQKALAGWRFPEGLVGVLAEPSWRARNMEEIRNLQLFLMSSCLLPPEEVAHFYGAPPASGNGNGAGKGAAAGAGAGAAAGGTSAGATAAPAPARATPAPGKAASPKAAR